MGDLTSRGYAASDAAAVADLFNRVEEHAGGHPGLTPDRTREFIGALVRDFDRDARLVFGDDGELVGTALVPTPPEGGFRVDLFGGVLPPRRGRGVGRELIGWQLDRAAEIHRQVAPDADWALHFGAAAADEEALRLYRRFGLEPVRYWFEMTAPTGQALEIAEPDGLRIDGYRPGHERQLHEAHTEAFADHWGYQRWEYEGWLTLTLDAENFAPQWSQVAYDGEEIAGYVLAYRDADPRRAYIGQVGVRRPWRRRGLAAAMLSRVLAAAGGAGRPTAALGVDAASPTGAVGVYERVGFSVESRGVTYETALPAIPRAERPPS